MQLSAKLTRSSPEVNRRPQVIDDKGIYLVPEQKIRTLYTSDHIMLPRSYSCIFFYITGTKIIIISVIIFLYHHNIYIPPLEGSRLLPRGPPQDPDLGPQIRDPPRFGTQTPQIYAPMAPRSGPPEPDSIRGTPLKTADFPKNPKNPKKPKKPRIWPIPPDSPFFRKKPKKSKKTENLAPI